MDQLTLAKIIGKINELPMLPAVTTRLLELMEDPKTTTAQITDVLSQDQVLVSKALKMVNSVYYGIPRKVATVTEAVTILGLDTLRTLIIGASIYNVINQKSNGRSNGQEVLWRHSAACAAASRMIAIRLGIEQKEHAFVAGLLHDIGKIIILSFMPKEYLNIIKSAELYNKSLFEIEKELLNFTHTDVGEIAAQKWNLPGLLVDAIGCHHDIEYEGENHELVAVVNLADIVSNMAGYGTANLPEDIKNEKILARYNLTRGYLLNVADEIKGKISIDFL